MAYADFSLSSQEVAVDSVTAAGNSFLHSNLANALSGAGTYCRAFPYTLDASSTNPYGHNKAVVDSGVLSGSLVDPTANVATSLRAYVRVSMPTLPTRGYSASDPFTGRVWAGLGSFIDENSFYMGGWSLELQSNVVANATAEVSLVLRGGAAANTSDKAGDESFNKIATVETGLSLDSWYLIRLDTIPRGSSAKTIKCYRSSDGGSSWTLLHTREVSFLDADWPSSATLGHFGMVSGAGAASGAHTDDPFSFVSYFDSFTASAETLS